MRKLVLKASRERGDTIIEVIFAITIFAFVAIGSISIMNQGLATGERALEITLVRQQINAQAEALRFVHAANVMDSSSHSSTWSRFRSTGGGGLGQSAASPFGADGGSCILPSGSPFIMNARTAQIWSGMLSIEPSPSLNMPPYPQVVYNDDNSDSKDDAGIRAAYGLWIESVPSSSPIVKRFIDFHIRACWIPPGSFTPMTIGTIVRLYDPA